MLVHLSIAFWTYLYPVFRSPALAELIDLPDHYKMKCCAIPHANHHPTALNNKISILLFSNPGSGIFPADSEQPDASACARIESRN